MKIATWNVNSIKMRLEAALAWLKLAKPDVDATKGPEQPTAPGTSRQRK